ncbi:MAG: TOBE domain-containing protein [Ectothiorhodospiraceae bacterium]|jgi:molybdate transport system regulatory protein|nr:TOBE domain-containing protein [Ectothiorhodospiraceae bacterium]
MTTTTAPIHLSGRLWLDRDGQGYLGGGRIELLERIGETGSISQAAKQMGMSYKAAWDAVEAMNNLAERPLVMRSTGGRGGGGTLLTEYGRQVTIGYRLMEAEYQRFLARMEAGFRDFDQINQLLRAMNMKTSARNQLRGRVGRVVKGAVNSEVHVDLGEGLSIFAIVTNEAVDELGLVDGKEALVLIKASFVLLTPDENIRISARNRLCGKVIETTLGAVNSEVKLELPGGRVLTAIITNDSLNELGFAPGSRACALVKASHVILAVND